MVKEADLQLNLPWHGKINNHQPSHLLFKEPGKIFNVPEEERGVHCPIKQGTMIDVPLFSDGSYYARNPRQRMRGCAHCIGRGTSKARIMRAMFSAIIARELAVCLRVGARTMPPPRVSSTSDRSLFMQRHRCTCFSRCCFHSKCTWLSVEGIRLRNTLPLSAHHHCTARCDSNLDPDFFYTS